MTVYLSMKTTCALKKIVAVFNLTQSPSAKYAMKSERMQYSHACCVIETHNFKTLNLTLSLRDSKNLEGTHFLQSLCPWDSQFQNPELNTVVVVFEYE